MLTKDYVCVRQVFPPFGEEFLSGSGRCEETIPLPASTNEDRRLRRRQGVREAQGCGEPIPCKGSAGASGEGARWAWPGIGSVLLALLHTLNVLYYF